MYESCEDPPIASWVVVNTHPNKERLAIENLQRQSFATYCPMLRRRVRHARQSRDVLRPMFPGYVFAGVSDRSMRWHAMLSTFGVRSVVRSGTSLSFLPNQFIQALKDREIDGAVSRATAAFRLGQSVTMAGGPFDGLIATIVELGDRDRLTVLLDLLNRPVKVKVVASGVAASA